MIMQAKGCGCRYRVNDAVQPHQEHCEHLCDKHKDRFILELYNKDKNFRHGMIEWMKITDEMNKCNS